MIVDVEDVRHVREPAGALGQQGGRHQLQHAVLGPGHPDLTGQPGTAGHHEALHPRQSRDAPGGTARRRLGSGHGRPPDPHLHQDRRRRDDRARRHEPGPQDQRPAGGVRRRGRGQQRDRRRAGPRRARPSRSPSCCDRCRTTCSTSAPTCAPRSCRTRSTRRCGCCRSTPRGSRRPATPTTRSCPSCAASSCRAGRATAALLHVARTVVRRAERVGLGAARGRAGHDQRGDRPLPQPALRPAVHPLACRQPRRRRHVAAGRRALAARPATGQRRQRRARAAGPPARPGSRSPPGGPSPAGPAPPRTRTPDHRPGQQRQHAHRPGAAGG